MAITRGNPSYSTGYFGPLQATAPYAKSGGEIIQHVSNGTNPNDTFGATYRTHIFDGVGASLINFERDGYVDLLIVAGGGAGGGAYQNTAGGGGGAGGVIEYYGYGVSAGTYRINVGRGGTGIFNGNTSEGGKANGQNSSFGALIATGGGAGGVHSYDDALGGGSGGGGADGSNYSGGGGVLGQGHSGGTNLAAGGDRAAGGGGAGEPGYDVTTSSPGKGGDGLAVAFNSNDLVYYAGGGGGSQRGAYTASPTGGLGGGANGVQVDNVYGNDAFFYGGGGSGACKNGTAGWHRGGNGYQGIVMVRYRIY